VHVVTVAAPGLNVMGRVDPCCVKVIYCGTLLDKAQRFSRPSLKFLLQYWQSCDVSYVPIFRSKALATYKYQDVSTHSCSTASHIASICDLSRF
jgi:hypothetical protein